MVPRHANEGGKVLFLPPSRFSGQLTISNGLRTKPGLLARIEPSLLPREGRASFKGENGSRRERFKSTTPFLSLSLSIARGRQKAIFELLIPFLPRPPRPPLFMGAAAPSVRSVSLRCWKNHARSVGAKSLGQTMFSGKNGLSVFRTVLSSKQNSPCRPTTTPIPHLQRLHPFIHSFALPYIGSRDVTLFHA